ncbi:MAG: hypothetical protein ACKV22_07580, partial [Bryobacteraceae bacterium]
MLRVWVCLVLGLPAFSQTGRILYQETQRTAASDLDFTVDSSGWRKYILEGEVQFTQPRGAFRLSIGAQLEAVPDESGSQIQLRISQDGKNIAEEIELLKPRPTPRWGAGAEEELKGLADRLPGWHGRWFPVRVEATPEEAWLAFDGRSLAPVSLAGKPPASLRLSLPSGSRLRNLVVREGAWPRGGYQPVSLGGYVDETAIRAQIPDAHRVLHVGGIPFLWHSGDAIDVGQAGLRLRKKPSGPGSLFQNPFNSIGAMDGDPLTILLRVPKRVHRRMYVLAAVPSKDRSPRLTVRLARYRGDAGCFFADSVVTVPGPGVRPGAGKPAALPASFPGGPGFLWVIEVPLDSGAFQGILKADVLQRLGNRSETLKHDADVRWLDIELTRELEPDLQTMLPLGRQSGVQVYAVTLEESPLEMVVTSGAPGNVFDSGEAPAFRVWLRNVSARRTMARLLVKTRDPYGVPVSRTLPVAVDAGAESTLAVPLPQKQFGKFDVSFELTDSGGRPLVERKTTFATLPPDRREAERDSPFGMWSWGGGHLSPPNDIEATLMRKAGARFTLGANYPSKHKLGIGTGTDIVTGIFYASTPITGEPKQAAGKMIEMMKTKESDPKYWQIYWEDMLSDRHHRRFPPAMIDRPPSPLTEAEQARFQAYWDRAEAYARAVRAQWPQAKLALGAYLNFTEEFLRKGFPKPLIDAISLEVGGFRAQPERPPDTDTVNGLYLLHELKRKYGYTDLDTILVESLYHGTGPGYLSERDQANYYVRDHLLGLAYGVKLFGMSAMLADVADDYYRTTWGSVGLCHRAPEANPKESYVAYSTMTSVLDRARYAGYLDTGSTSVYALRFQAKEGGNLYAFWTVRGERDVELHLTAQATLIDAMHNERSLPDGRLVVGESPVYVRTSGEVARVTIGRPRLSEKPPAGAVLLDSLADTSRWTPREERSDLLETVNPRYPRRPGQFEWTAAKDAEKGAAGVITAKPVPGSPLVPMYGILESPRGVRIEGQPKRLGLWVKGNSSWGRITFELADAKGERWTFAGGSEDSYGRSFINFDGWRWMEIDLCGHFRNDYPWPLHGNWTSRNGDGLVDFPVTVTKLIVEMRD